MYINRLINPDKSDKQPGFSFSDGITYINTQQWHFAYVFFVKMHQNSKSKTVDLLYNTALCFFMAKENAKAFNLLSEAFTQMSTPSIASDFRSEIPEALFVNEYLDNQHYLALEASAVQQNTQLIKLRIRRLLVDVHLQLENWQEVIKLSELPDMIKCKNVQTAVEVAKSKTNKQI